MNIPCGVIRDLLPLYAENLASEESAALLREHLETCAQCREYLETLKAPAAPESDSRAPMERLKKELRRRRWRAASLAALVVFTALFAVLARLISEEPVAYDPALLRVEGLEPYDPAEEHALSVTLHQDVPTEGERSALVLSRAQEVTGVKSEWVVDEDTGVTTVYLQYFRSRAELMIDDAEGSFAVERREDAGGRDVFYPAPDRLVYGFGPDQVLLWGEELSGGVQILPRLMLSYLAILALGAEAVLGALWALRRTKPERVLWRQLFFAPLSWLLGEALVKGTQTHSVFLSRDLTLIGIEALGIYALLTLWALTRQDRRA